MAPNALPRPNELVDPGTPNTLSADASPGRFTADQTGPSLARLCAIGIVGLGGAAVAFEFLSRH